MIYIEGVLLKISFKKIVEFYNKYVIINMVRMKIFVKEKGERENEKGKSWKEKEK